MVLKKLAPLIDQIVGKDGINYLGRHVDAEWLQTQLSDATVGIDDAKNHGWFGPDIKAGHNEEYLDGKATLTYVKDALTRALDTAINPAVLNAAAIEDGINPQILHGTPIPPRSGFGKGLTQKV